MIVLHVQAASTRTPDEFQSLVCSDSFDFRFHCGYSKVANFKDKDEMIKAIWLHYVHFNPHAELQQLRKGFLETLQMELLTCIHPNSVRSLLVASECFDVTPEYLLERLVIDYSDNGSNNRTKEEAIVCWWSEYVTDCNGT